MISTVLESIFNCIIMIWFPSWRCWARVGAECPVLTPAAVPWLLPT